MNAQTMALIRAGVALIGQLFAADVIPTGVPGLGPKIGSAMIAVALAVPAGEKNQPVVPETTDGRLPTS